MSRFRGQIMGLLGLISAPLAFIVARGVHKAMADMLASGALPAGGPSPLVLGTVKAIEYAALGLILGSIADKKWAGFRAHAAIGLVIGLIFGGGVITYSIHLAATPIPTPGLVSRGINEIIFPVGCSVVFFTGQAFSRRFAT